MIKIKKLIFIRCFATKKFLRMICRTCFATDAEGNFNIKITGLSENTFKNAQFTFQIGLHKDDEPVLNYIMNSLKCVAKHDISKSKNRINYFVNDRNSLLHVILPIFDSVNLNSSKYHHFVLFKKAVTLKIKVIYLI